MNAYEGGGGDEGWYLLKMNGALLSALGEIDVRLPLLLLSCYALWDEMK